MPNYLMQGKSPYESSGFLMEEPKAVEVTLCGEPAVAGAKFLVTRSAGAALKLQMPIRHSKQDKQQVFGYVSIPWLEDWYGDVMDPLAIEHAAQSFMHNLQTGNTWGNGVGEEHNEFWSNAYVFESCLDREGKLAGVPGGWWIGMQITNPTTWEKVTSSRYTGFSLGSMVYFTNTKNTDFQNKLWELLPDLSAIQQKRPSKGKYAAMEDPGAFGFPTEEYEYADPVNNRFPINTRSRAYATLRYSLQTFKAEGYSIEEYKYVVRRMLAAIALSEDVVPDAVLARVGFKSIDSAKKYAGDSGLKIQSRPSDSTYEEENDMALTEKDQELINAAVQSALGEALKPITEKLAAAPADPKNQAKPDEPKKPEPSEQDVMIDKLIAKMKEQGLVAADQAKKDDPKKDDPKKPDDTKKAADDKKCADPSDQAADTGEVVTAAVQAAIQGLVPTLTALTEKVQGLSETVSSAPGMRATQMRTLNATQKTQKVEVYKKKIQSGEDFTADEYAEAESLGFDFDLTDPSANV